MIKTSLLFLIIISFSCAQNKSELSGKWKLTEDFGKYAKKNSVTQYVILKDDGTYVWGIDSTQSEPMKNITIGKWEVTTKPEIRIIPDDKSAEVKYFVQRTDTRYDYYAYDLNGIKTQENRIEHIIYIEHIDK